MVTFDGSLARTLDFGDSPLSAEDGTATHRRTPAARAGLDRGHARGRSIRGGSPDSTTASDRCAPLSMAGFRLTVSAVRPADKYRALEHRRRQAQIQARRLVAALD